MTMRRSIWLRIATATTIGAALAGCVFGPRAQTFEPAADPHGVSATLHINGRNVRAEVLEVRDSGLVVLSNAIVAFVPYHAMQSASFKNMSLALWSGSVPGRDATDELRRVSRFPQGLTPENERRLLAVYHQTSISTLITR